MTTSSVMCDGTNLLSHVLKVEYLTVKNLQLGTAVEQSYLSKNRWNSKREVTLYLELFKPLVQDYAKLTEHI